MIAFRSIDGSCHPIPVQVAISQCGLCSDLADDLRTECDSERTVEIQIPVSPSGAHGLATFMLLPAPPSPLAGSAWDDGEVVRRFTSVVETVIGTDEQLTNGGISIITETMRAADFVRHERCLSFWANYVASRLAAASPADIKQWCGREGALTHDEQQSVVSMHRLLLEQKL